MTRYWFKPRRYGLGATPTSWKAWALVIGYGLIQMIAGVLLGIWPHTASGKPVTFVLFSVLTSAVLIYICIRKTDGAWRWRWGED